MPTFKEQLRAAVAELIETLHTWMRTDCRHVIARGVMPPGVFYPVRCHEPSDNACEMHYCIMHCKKICHGGVDGDELEVEPEPAEAEPETVWEPKQKPAQA